MMFQKLVVLVLAFTVIACKQEIKKEIELVNSIQSPAGENSSLPFLYANENKTLLSWVEKEGDSLTELKYAALVEGEWQQAKSILLGSDWFVNWADFPAIAERDGNLISHVLKKSSVGTYSYDIKLNLLQKGEERWRTNLPLHADETPTEHGFVSTIPYKDGFFTTWLDGRNTEENTQGNRGAMTLRAAEVSVLGEITNEIELDNRICDCCQTTAAITANGPVVIYRDRSDEEVRDMSIVRFVNEEWTAPKTIHADNWQIKGCPVNGPKASALGNTLAMAWFTAASGIAKVQIIFSSDGGARFENPITVSETKPLGRVAIKVLDESNAIVSWMETHNGKAQLKALKINKNGTKGNSLVITEMNASRSSGFPQMERVGDTLYFAWTDIESSTTQVKTTFVQLASFK